jgi:ureidoglycolate lyase
MKIKVKKLTEKSFAEFGVILGEQKGKKPNIKDALSDVWLGFSDLMGIGSKPGRHITYLKIHSKPKINNKIERHCTTAESFIPLEGRSIIMLVSPENTDKNGRPNMKKCKAFLMDGANGILLKPGTWHAVPYPLTKIASYLVLVDDSIIEKNDLNITEIEEVKFDLSQV